MLFEENWLKIISWPKKLIAPIWPRTGYVEVVMHHCEDCVYLLKDETTRCIFKDEEGRGRCSHPMVVLDFEVKKDSQGRPIVNIKCGCCEYGALSKRGIENGI